MVTAPPSGIGSIGGGSGAGSLPMGGGPPGSSIGTTGTMNSMDMSLGVASNSHPHPSADSVMPPNNIYIGHTGGGAYHHGNKQLTKIKTEGDRLSKRSSSDVGLLPSTKRKYRRRKLSSSNESTSSESLSLASEPLQHTIPSSPSITASRSPSIFHSETKKIGNEDSTLPGPESHSTNNDMDCGNLDLLASVTQRIDKFDRLPNEMLSPKTTTTNPPTQVDHAPIVKMHGSPLPPPVSVVTTIDSKEGIKRNSSVSQSNSGCGNNTGGRKRKTTSTTTGSSSNTPQQPRPSNRYSIVVIVTDILWLLVLVLS